MGPNIGDIWNRSSSEAEALVSMLKAMRSFQQRPVIFIVAFHSGHPPNHLLMPPLLGIAMVSVTGHPPARLITVP